MRIGIVGGLDRSERSYVRLARDRGHEVEYHDGDMRGTATATLAGLVERADLVVIVTDVNSHNAVRAARRLLRSNRRPAVLVRRLGLSRFLALMQAHAPAPA
jgi:hypothetical protein